jgi:N-acyl-D-aspartate/D-glutamate deacylase
MYCPACTNAVRGSEGRAEPAGLGLVRAAGPHGGSELQHLWGRQIIRIGLLLGLLVALLWMPGTGRAGLTMGLGLCLLGALRISPNRRQPALVRAKRAAGARDARHGVVPRTAGITRSSFVVGASCITGTLAPAFAGDVAPPNEVREAVERGLRLVEKAAANYPSHRTCFSCHHQTLPMLAMVTARRHGLTVEEARIQAQADFTRASFKEHLESMKQGKGVGGGALTVGYGLWALELAGRQPDEVTEAMVEYVVQTQRPDGHWLTQARRPPLEESLVTAAALPAVEIRKFATPGQRARVEAVIAKAKSWIAAAPVKLQEDRNHRLWGLRSLGGDESAAGKARAEVLGCQHDDGGWSARDDLPSDAYATGQTLVRLHHDGVAIADPAYQRGVRFLLGARQSDGSWKVETRARPFQVYFDNGDPHGKSQFISTAATAWAVAALALTLPQAPAPEPFDLVIRNGRVVDGTGNPWFFGDVAIRGDRIVQVGAIAADFPARRTIEARGLVVAPGFIDMHSHSDMPLLEDGHAQSKIRQGVTTEVLGEDTSGGPATGKAAAKTFTGGGKTLKWSTFGGYLDALEQSGIATNVASYVGLGTLLQCVQGDTLDRPDAGRLGSLKTLLDSALDEGAFGLSTMLAGARELNVTTDDLVELCQVVRRHGGVYSSHIRNEGTDVFNGINEAIAVGERSGVPVDIIHLKIADRSLWGRMKDVVALIDAARARGVNVQANVYPYTRGNNDLVTIIPPWAHEGGTRALLARLRDSSQRARLKTEIRQGVPGWYDHFTAVGGDWSRMLIAAHLTEKNRRYEGKTMDAVIAERSAGINPAPDPLDVMFDLLIEEGGAISTIYAHHTEEDMNLALVQPWCSVGSDGSALAVEGALRRGNPHPRSFGTFPRILGVYVRERRLLTLEDAVRKMTSLNAAKLGIADRGLIKEGLCADVTVFDPAKVADKATYLDPFQYGEGIEFVIVNGHVVLDRGKHTSAMPGRALRKGGKSAR